jgi:hypothetical protein
LAWMLHCIISVKAEATALRTLENNFMRTRQPILMISPLSVHPAVLLTQRERNEKTSNPGT